MLYTDNIGLKKPAYSDSADIADINENMDTIDREFGNRYLKSETYSVEQANNAIAQAIEALPNGLVYRGAVNYYKDLPTVNNELGDTYSVKYQGETGTTADGNEYAWGEYDGSLQWIKLGVNAYTKDEIDEQHEDIKSDILKVQRHSAAMAMNSQGWYRIAECIIGQGRSAILRLERTYGNNPPEIITLLVNVAYNVASQPFFDCNILDKYVKSSLLKKLRIVIPTELSLNSKMHIDVWNDGTSANSLKTTIFGESVLSSSNEPITILNPTIAPELPEGYTSKEFDLTVGDVFERLSALETALAQAQTE